MNNEKMARRMDRRRAKIEERCIKKESADKEAAAYEMANSRSVGSLSLDSIPYTRLLKDSQHE